MKATYFINQLRLYYHVFRLALGEVLEYRLSTLFKVIRYPLSVWLIYFFWRAVDAGRGLATTDLVTYFLLVNIFFSWSNFHTYSVEDDIRLGNLNRLLTRPIKSFLYYFSYQSAGVLFSVLIQTLLVIGLAFITKPSLTADPFTWFLVIVFCLLIYLFSFLLYYTVSLCSVWWTEVYAWRWSYMGVMRFLTGLYIPITYFSASLKNFLYWTPFPHLASTPISLLQNQITNSQGLSRLMILAGWIFIMYIVYKSVSHRAFKAYEGNGG